MLLLIGALLLETNAGAWQTKDKLTLIFSVAGAVISLVTLYLTVLRPAEIKVFLGDFLIVRFTWDDYVFIAPEVGLYNAGAKVGTVSKISGSLVSLDADRSVVLNWKEVWERRDAKAFLAICQFSRANSDSKVRDGIEKAVLCHSYSVQIDTRPLRTNTRCEFWRASEGCFHGP